jgi:DNA-binding winged helix-turn-helix (wHTH) protein/Tol biopolymer transport system component
MRGSRIKDELEPSEGADATLDADQKPSLQMEWDGGTGSARGSVDRLLDINFMSREKEKSSDKIAKREVHGAHRDRSRGGAEVGSGEISLQFTASHLQVLTSSTSNAFISWHLALTISNFVRLDFARRTPLLRSLMQEPKRANVLRFGVFDVDLDSGELRKSGSRIRLQEQPFKILMALLEHPGEVVTREELRRLIWPEESFGDFDHAVNVAVGKLRTALNDSAEDSRLIETLPRRGYRFIGPAVTRLPTRAADSSASSAEGRKNLDGLGQIRAHRGKIGLAAVLQAAKRHKGALFAGSLMLFIGAGYGFHSLFRVRHLAVPFQDFTITQATDTGNSVEAAISPDGKYILSVTDQNGKRGLFLRHIATGSTTQVVAPGSDYYTGPVFSPDGSYLYFLAAQNASSGIRTLLRAPILGGRPQTLVRDVSVEASIAPDERLIAYAREDSPEPGKVKILVANSDGSNEKVLVTFAQPAGFYGYEHLAWSPSGKLIAVTTNSVGDSLSKVLLVDVTSGHSKAVGASQDRSYKEVTWAPDESGLYIMYSSSSTGFDRWQVGFLSLPDGEFREITKDTNYYQGLSLSANGKTIATVRVRPIRTVFVVDTRENMKHQLVPLFQNEQDYRYWGLAGAGELYVAGPRKISRLTFNGNHTGDVLTDPQGYFAAPAACNGAATEVGTKEHRYLVFNRFERQANKIAVTVWRIGADGSNPLQLSSGTFDAMPVCSADGKLVYYADFVSREMKQVPSEGGKAQVVPHSDLKGSLIGAWFGISADSRQLAMVVTESERVAQKSAQQKIALIPLGAAAGPSASLLDPDPRISGPPIFAGNGKALLYSITENGVDNLWFQPIQGGPGHQITNFSSQQLGHYELLPDGKNLFLMREQRHSDVVILREVAAPQRPSKSD